MHLLLLSVVVSLVLFRISLTESQKLYRKDCTASGWSTTRKMIHLLVTNRAVFCASQSQTTSHASQPPASKMPDIWQCLGAFLDITIERSWNCLGKIMKVREIWHGWVHLASRLKGGCLHTFWAWAKLT